MREIEEQANKAIFRPKCTWARPGKKPTGYFLRLEKQRSKEKILSNIIKGNGEIISDPKALLEECRLFYQNLYTEDPDKLTPIDEVMISIRGIHHPTLSQISRDQLEAPFAKEEVKKALSKISEFYSAFWDQVSTCLFDSPTLSLQEGMLCTEQRMGGGGGG